VCNPPYISSGRLAKDSAPLLSHEPRAAFDGGPFGFAVHQRVISEAPRLLRPGGHLAVEVGVGQERQVSSLFERTGQYQEVSLRTDEQGVGRVVVGRRR